jgi:hypothetical protein
MAAAIKATTASMITSAAAMISAAAAVSAATPAATATAATSRVGVRRCGEGAEAKQGGNRGACREPVEY